MLRITRIIKREILFDILDLPNISKIEIKQGKNNLHDLTLCRVNVYIVVPTFEVEINNILEDLNHNALKSTALTARRDEFVKESFLEKINFKSAEQCKYWSEKYSQEFFINFYKDAQNKKNC